MASDDVYIERFTATERAVHWVHATAFFGLLATGLVLYVPRLSILIGRRPLVKNLHAYTAVAWIAALLLVVVLGDRRRLRQTLRELDEFDSDDLLWLRRRPAPQGRFNAGQKVNAVLTGAFACSSACRDRCCGWESAITGSSLRARSCCTTGSCTSR